MPVFDHKKIGPYQRRRQKDNRQDPDPAPLPRPAQKQGKFKNEDRRQVHKEPVGKTAEPVVSPPGCGNVGKQNDRHQHPRLEILRPPKTEDKGRAGEDDHRAPEEHTAIWQKQHPRNLRLQPVEMLLPDISRQIVGIYDKTPGRPFPVDELGKPYRKKSRQNRKETLRPQHLCHPLPKALPGSDPIQQVDEDDHHISYPDQRDQAETDATQHLELCVFLLLVALHQPEKEGKHSVSVDVGIGSVHGNVMKQPGAEGNEQYRGKGLSGARILLGQTIAPEGAEKIVKAPAGDISQLIERTEAVRRLRPKKFRENIRRQEKGKLQNRDPHGVFVHHLPGIHRKEGPGKSADILRQLVQKVHARIMVDEESRKIHIVTVSVGVSGLKREEADSVEHRRQQKRQHRDPCENSDMQFFFCRLAVLSLTVPSHVTTTPDEVPR